MLNSVIDDISRDVEKRRLERLEAMLQIFEEAAFSGGPMSDSA